MQIFSTRTLVPSRRTLAAAAIVVAGSTLSISAFAAFKSFGSSLVRFEAKGPLGLQINGKGSGVKAYEKGGELFVESRVDDLKTGISLRDSHLRKVINADANPVATLRVARKSLSIPAPGQSSTGTAKGHFKLNGIEKPMTFTYEAKRSPKKVKNGSLYKVKAEGWIDVTDHGIDKSKLCKMAVCARPKVKIQVVFRLQDQ